MKKPILHISALIFMVITALFASCKKEEMHFEENHGIKNLDGIAEFLGCHGFDTDSLDEVDGYIAVEGDIYFEKEMLMDMIEHSHEEFDIDNLFNEVEDRQYAVSSSALISMANTSNIKYYIDNSISNLPNIGSSMVTEIVNACNNWQNITKCRVSFSRVYNHSSAQISFFADNSPSLPPGMQNLTWNASTGIGNLAAACFPKLGSIGRFVSIQDGMAQFPQNYTAQRRQNIVTHEIGHALGLRHNAGWNEGPGTDGCTTFVSSPVLIAGTPFSDPSSVMVSGTVENTISSNDILAMQYMYPDGYSVPKITNIVSNSSGNVTIQTTPPLGQSPYKVLVVRRNLAGNLQQVTEFITPGNGTSFTVPCPNGAWTFQIAYQSYGTYGFVSGKYPAIVGLFELKRKGTTKNLDAAGCGSSNGTNVFLWEDNNLDCQRWVVSLQSDGFYELKRQNTTKNLDAAGCGSGNGTNVHLWEDNNYDCQRWKITLESDGFFELKRKGTNMNLDASWCGTENYTNVQLYEDNSLDCQRWGLTFIQ